MLKKKTAKTQPALNWSDQYPIVFFLFVYFVFSLFTYRDYGISWDEYSHYSMGSALVQYLAGSGNPADFLIPRWDLDFYTGGSHLYPAVLSFFNQTFSMEYFHWLNMAFASLAFAAVFEMLLAQTGNPWQSMMGPAFLALTPQFWGQIPMNPNDPSFAVLYVLSLSAIFSKRLRAKLLLRIIIIGLLFGLTFCIRIAGLSLFFVFVLFEIYETTDFSNSDSIRGLVKNLANFFPSLLLVFIVSSFVLMVSWPYLGADYFLHLKNSILKTAHFPYEVHFIFMGHEVSSLNLPWYYLLVWLLVSTPLFLLFFLFLSVFFIRRAGQNRLFVLLTMAFGVNLALVLWFKPVVYLGMRHFLFFLPILSTLAALSANEFYGRYTRKNWGRILLALAVLNAVTVLVEYVRLHPYEYVYFNELVGGVKGAYGKFEIEYMATSTKEAVEWIQTNAHCDSARPCRIFTKQEPFQAIYYLNPQTRYADKLEDADYLLVLPAEGKHLYQNTLLHSISREDVPLMDIYTK